MAELAIRVGVDVQPGQLVVVLGQVENAPLTREIARALLPSGRWASGNFQTVFGHRHVPNLPTEEVFTSPDRRRADGELRSTRPLQVSGTLVRDLELEFREGRIVEVRASSGADLIRGQVAIDDGAARLGEVSLVDGSSEVGKLGLTFYNTLFDENATCHIAYGDGFAFCVADKTNPQPRFNYPPPPPPPPLPPP